ncbi:MAG TPA: hypothetical protein VJR89_31910 [Polyangiales bacterium]|nr:hypothetical protein [Polyangiales bacterium]
MGVVCGKWSFARGSAPPATPAIAAALARATGLQVSSRGASETADERIHVAELAESLFDIEREANSLQLSSFIPAHPYLWENLDRVLTDLGGRVEVSERFWQPHERLQHLRRSWQRLSPRQ